MIDEAALRDACWKLYAEHCTHVRHHETQRSTVAASILAIAAALLGLITYDKAITVTDLPLSALVILLGGFGALFSSKQYERASLHTERARRYRDAVDATLEDRPLKRLKSAADNKHSAEFPHMEKLRLNKFWVALYVLLAMIGVILSTIAVFAPQIAR